MFGLGLGLIVALLVYIDGRNGAGRSAEAVSSSDSPNVVDAPSSPRVEPTGELAEEEFGFYELLPQFEVIVPEVETPTAGTSRAAAIEAPGSYVLQAGSFRTMREAERQKASLALLGIESTIQVVSIDTAVYHRVRIGPISDLDKLNGIRRRLIDAEVDTLLMQLSR